MPKLEPDVIADLIALRDQLLALPAKGGRTALIEAGARGRGVSTHTLRAWLRLYAGYQPQRKVRADKGRTRFRQKFQGQAAFRSRRRRCFSALPDRPALRQRFPRAHRPRTD